LQAVLEKVGKKLKKNNVSVDVVSFGDCAEGNREKLEAFVASVNKDNNSHFVEAPLGSNLCDFLLSSPILSQGGYGGGEEGGGGAGGVYNSKCRLPCMRSTSIHNV
jgi:26S proteasome regulatory subunit N10